MTGTTKIKITAVLEIENDLIEDQTTLIQELVNEFIKMKSGEYENIACGFVETAEIID